MTDFYVRAELFPTEDPARVKNAVSNLFPDVRLIEEGNFLLCRPVEIGPLLKLIADQKIKYAFVEEINRNAEGSRFCIKFNKQAALAGRVNITDEPKPLGSIELSGEVNNPVLYFEKLLSIVGYVTSRQGKDYGSQVASSGK
jgi:predicted RNA binding protein with dsRBD fold (UPF0201 family)